MTTIINNPDRGERTTDSSHGSLIVILLVLIIGGILLYYYGLPGRGASDVNVSVPEQVDVNVSTPNVTPEGGGQ